MIFINLNVILTLIYILKNIFLYLNFFKDIL